MNDTRFIYLKTTSQVYTNDTSDDFSKSQYMLMYDFDDLNGSLELSGLKGGLVTNGNIMLFKPHDISLKILFDDREARSNFAGDIYTITQIGYSDNTQYENSDGKRVYWADCVVSSYVNNENPYINGFEQELKITVTTPWSGLVSGSSVGEKVTALGTKTYAYLYGDNINLIDNPDEFKISQYNTTTTNNIGINKPEYAARILPNLKKGNTLTISLYINITNIKALDGRKRAGFELSARDISGSVQYFGVWTDINNLIIGGDVVKRISSVFPISIDFNRIESCGIYSQGIQADYVEVSNLKIELGNQATPYTQKNGYTYGATELDIPKLQLDYNTRYVIDYPDTGYNVRYGYIGRNGSRVEVLNFTIDNAFNDILTIGTDWTVTGKISGTQSLSKFLGNIPIETIRRLTSPDDSNIYPVVYFEFYNSAGVLLPYSYNQYITQNFI